MTTDTSLDSLRQTLQRALDTTHEQAITMPAGFYTNPALLELERNQLFKQEWVCLGRVDEIPQPGDYFTTQLGNEPLLIIRGRDDSRVRVLSNVCRHRGMLLTHGKGNREQVRCPYHFWTYDTTGQLLRAPLIPERDDFAVDQCRLPEFNSEVWMGFLFVNLAGNATALAPSLNGLEALTRNYHMEQMTASYGHEQTWATNWKCLTENFMEGYHLSTVHFDTLHPVTPTRLCEHFPAGERYLGYYSRFPDDYPQRGVHHPDLRADEERCSLMFAVLPGLVAGVAGHMVAYVCIQPDTCDTVKAKLGMAFWDPDISAQDITQASTFFETIMAEDKIQLENLQRGLHSDHYQQSPLAPPNYEGTVLDFYQYLARHLAAADMQQ